MQFNLTVYDFIVFIGNQGREIFLYLFLFFKFFMIFIKIKSKNADLIEDLDIYIKNLKE